MPFNTRNITDHRLNLARGLAAGITTGRINGVNETLGTNHTIWVNSNSYVFPTTAEPLRFRAGNSNDVAGGTGARLVEVKYLDENFDEQTEYIVPGGTSPSDPTTGTALRVNSVIVVESGTKNASNTGSLFLEQSTSGDLMSRIGPGIGQQHQAVYSVPRLHTLFVTNISIQSDVANTSMMELQVTESPMDAVAPFRNQIRKPWAPFEIPGGNQPFPQDSYIVIPGGSDINLKGTHITGAVPQYIASIDYTLVSDDARY